MTYVISSPELYIIDHTLVENAYRGQGLGDMPVCQGTFRTYL
ncbi:hypothetical protein MKY66_15675 [Paenibacillus sp. FSL R5-0766]